MNSSSIPKIALLLSLTAGLIFSVHSIIAGQSDFEEEFSTAAEIPIALNMASLAEEAAVGPNCRYGVSTGYNGVLSGQVEKIDDLGAGWFLNFSNTSVPAENFAEFVPVLRVKQDRDMNGNRLNSYTVLPDFPSLATTISKRPGALWIVGNEVDRYQVQDDIMPDLYAVAYHEIYNFIKDQDPTAQVAISSLVEVTPGRLQYLDIFWDSYFKKYGTPVPADVWNMHLYILPEKRWVDGLPTAAHIAIGTDPAIAIKDSNGSAALCSRSDVYCYAEHDDMSIFNEQVLAMRQWMKDHGHKEKPLIISEYSILYVYLIDPVGCYLKDEYGGCFTPQRVSKFMDNSFEYLETTKNPNLGYSMDEDRLVQQWLWYSIWVPEDSTGGSSNLYIEDLSSRTMVGQKYRDEVASIPLEVNLFPVDPDINSAYTNELTGTVDVDISVGVMNGGNTVPPRDIKVTFFSDSGLTKEIGTATLAAPSQFDAGMVGCARKTVRVKTTWTGLIGGKHHYWVKVDSDGAISESNESDNVANGWVYVNPPHQIYLPHSQKFGGK